MEEELNFKMEKIRKLVERYQNDVDDNIDLWKQTLNDLINIKKDVSQNGVFSENEEFNEIKTEDIKFLMIPYYQSELMQKFMENRENNLNFALKFYDEFYKFLEQCEYLDKDKITMYKILTKPSDEDEEPKKPSFEVMSKEREDKISKFKYKKLLSEKLKVFINI
jgi:immunoglobulin-binding protein 1